MAIMRCKNCGDLHRSDSRKCLAWPTHSWMPYEEQMKTCRQAVVRAKAVGDKAAVIEGKCSPEGTDPLKCTVNNTQMSFTEAGINGTQRSRPSSSHLIRSMLINVGRCGIMYEIANIHACELHLDLVLIQ